jgi:ABC-2 type transport system permease protein
MSSATATLKRPRPVARDATRPSIATLTRVELRKTVDTRAGFWLLIAVALLTVGIVILTLLTGHDHSLRVVMSGAVEPSATLLPIVGILLVTAEFSQRTALSTFAVVPQRNRVLLAKLAAGTILALLALVGCRVFASIGVLADGASLRDAVVLPGWAFGQSAFYVVGSMIGGIAFGALLRSPALAIVLSFVLPLGVVALGAISAIKDVVRWIDTTVSWGNLSEHSLGATDWGRALVTLLVWVLVPLAVGAWQLQRADIR